KKTPAVPKACRSMLSAKSRKAAEFAQAFNFNPRTPNFVFTGGAVLAGASANRRRAQYPGGPTGNPD
ncbi:MAG: hypothetical protein L3J16_01650, partial [Anaerolineales bacterium]|nr:hypothetical protein [Anaerolineales bacterium]